MMIEAATTGIESRSIWLSGAGRTCYETWSALALKDLEGDMPSSEEWQEIPVLSPWELSEVLSYHVRKRYGDFMSPPHLPNPNAAVLLANKEDILTKTAATGLGEGEEVVLQHAGDSLTFGLEVSMALAIDAIGSREEIADDPRYLDEIADVLEDPDFTECLDVVGGAGFGVLKATFGKIGQQGLCKRIEELGFEKEFISGEIPAVIYRNETGKFVVHPKVAVYLASTMKAQNNGDFTNVNPNSFGAMQIASRAMTSGCPLRKPAASRIEENHGKSGIVTTSEWLATMLRRVDAQQADKLNEL